MFGRLCEADPSVEVTGTDAEHRRRPGAISDRIAEGGSAGQVRLRADMRAMRSSRRAERASAGSAGRPASSRAARPCQRDAGVDREIRFARGSAPWAWYALSSVVVASLLDVRFIKRVDLEQGAGDSRRDFRTNSAPSASSSSHSIVAVG